MVIRDIAYKLPDIFPVKLMDIEHNIRNAKTITWMAEYNTNCIEKIKGNALGIVGIYGIAEVLGPSDVYIDSMERFFKENSIKSGHLDLSDWDKSITGFLDGYVKFQRIFLTLVYVTIMIFPLTRLTKFPYLETLQWIMKISSL